MKRVIIVGAGGHGQVVADAILDGGAKSGLMLLGFVDDDSSLKGKRVLGAPVLGPVAELRRIRHDAIVVAIGDNAVRSRMFEALRRRGERFAKVVHPAAKIGRDVKIGYGAVIIAGAIVNTGARIGRNVIINSGATVDHHTRIGPHAHIAPGANLGGDVVVGAGSLVGIGSAILPGIVVGRWATVGAGAVVVRKVVKGATVVGSPARACDG